MLIRLRGCPGWSAPLLFATSKLRQVFSRRGPNKVGYSGIYHKSFKSFQVDHKSYKPQTILQMILFILFASSNHFVHFVYRYQGLTHVLIWSSRNILTSKGFSNDFVLNFSSVFFGMICTDTVLSSPAKSPIVLFALKSMCFHLSPVRTTSEWDAGFNLLLAARFTSRSIMGMLKWSIIKKLTT